MISIVVLTYNSKNFISPCLDSVFSQDYQDFEVIVVDNGSNDGTPELVKKYSKVILIENKENFGACKGRNQGIEASSGEWILTLDCDVVLEKYFFPKVIKKINSISFGIGALQPKILNNDHKTINSCGIYLTWFRRFYDIGRSKKDREQFSEMKHVFGISSACGLYRRKMLEDIKENTGYFDERFFFLVEDIDLSWRSVRKGWRAIFCPDIVSYHSGGSCNFSYKLRQFFCFRNRYYSIVKNEGLIRYLMKILPVLFYDIPRIIFLLLTNPYRKNK